MIELNDTTVELPLHFYHRFYLVFKVEGESVVNHFLSSIKIVYTILLITNVSVRRDALEKRKQNEELPDDDF